MAVSAYVKDPNARLDYTIDWSTDWLVPTDTIVGSTFSAPTGITVDSSTFTATTTTVWLTGGTANTEYLVTNHITTAQGRQEDQTLIILCLER